MGFFLAMAMPETNQGITPEDVTTSGEVELSDDELSQVTGGWQGGGVKPTNWSNQQSQNNYGNGKVGEKGTWGK